MRGSIFFPSPPPKMILRPGRAAQRLGNAPRKSQLRTRVPRRSSLSLARSPFHHMQHMGIILVERLGLTLYFALLPSSIL